MDEYELENRQADMEVVSGGFVGIGYPMASTLPHPDAMRLGTVVRSRVDGRRWKIRETRQRLWDSGHLFPSTSYVVHEWVSLERRNATTHLRRRGLWAALAGVGFLATAAHWASHRR